MKKAGPSASRSGACRQAGKDPDTIALEKRVSDALGLAVSVNHRDPGGTVQISYRNLDQLDEVMRRPGGRRVAGGWFFSTCQRSRARRPATTLALSF